MGFNEGPTRLKSRGEWKFEDLAVFTAEYQKLYSYYYHLLDDKEIDDEEIFWGRSTGAFPLAGWATALLIFLSVCAPAYLTNNARDLRAFNMRLRVGSNSRPVSKSLNVSRT